MPKGVSKLQLLIDLKNKLKMGLDSAKKQVDQATGGMQRKLNNFSTRAGKSFAALRNEVPMLGSAISTLVNPVSLAAAAVVALSVGIGAATAEAQRFSGGFRELNMLNLDKTKKEIAGVKNMIRDTAFEKGFDAVDTTKAFFDVQSTTGKYGLEVDAIVSKQGEFARLMQADFNNWIAGTAKAMANYGFGAEKLDEFNKAAFATVQTGVTTFDELAKVQSVYAGAASAAKQNFASANKLFSIFTVKVKSVDEAATLTKALFNDLTKKETIDAFAKVGINVFDSNKQFKQADVLLLELQKRFKELGTSDQKLIQLKNQFTGSEGLISFVQAATDKTNQLQNTINTFDTTQFALPKALEIAKNDINYINEQLENRTKVLMGEIGDNFLPIKKFFLELTNNTLKGFNQLFTDLERFSDKAKNQAGKDIINRLPGLANPSKLNEAEFNNLMGLVDKRISFYKGVSADNEKFTKNDWSAFNRLSGRQSEGMYKYQYASGAVETLLELQRQARAARTGMPFVAGNNTEGSATGTGNGNSTNNKLASDAEKIKSGSQSKNVTINIDSFIKGFTPTSQSINSLNKDELERWMTQMFLRVVQSAEVII